METPKPLAFGGVIKEQDQRDYDLHKINESILGSSTLTVKSSNDYKSIPIDFQGQRPMCGPHAGARFKNIQNLRDKKIDIHCSPRYNTHNIKAIDGYPLDAGTDINSIFKAMRTKGVCKFELTGNDVSLSDEAYTNFPITAEMDSDASTNETDAEAFTYSPTFEQICATIDAHGAAVLLLRVGQNMYTAKDGTITWDKNLILPLSPTNFPMTGGHFMVAENYDKSIGRIYGANEWGVDWGDEGYFYFDKNYMPYIVAIGAAVNKKSIPPDAIPKFVFNKDLSFGMTSIDVKELQKVLNKNPLTQVAVSGAGSPGNETDYFGLLTKSAVQKYQTLNHISPISGFCGPLTRASLNK